MAIRSLKDVEKIGEYQVIDMNKLAEQYPEKFTDGGAMDWKWFESEIRPKHFIYVRHDKNSISFTIQDGPVKENGVNGCQVDTLIETAAKMIETLDKEHPSEHNATAYGALTHALIALEKRKKEREERGVEGRDLP